MLRCYLQPLEDFVLLWILQSGRKRCTKTFTTLFLVFLPSFQFWYLGILAKCITDWMWVWADDMCSDFPLIFQICGLNKPKFMFNWKLATLPDDLRSSRNSTWLKLMLLICSSSSMSFWLNSFCKMGILCWPPSGSVLRSSGMKCGRRLIHC